MPDTELAPLPFGRDDIEQTISSRFEDVARAFPDHLALTGRDGRWTYEKLNRRANEIASAIRTRTSPGPGCVAHLFSLSPEMVVATLAVLKAGKTCLALHPAMPPEAHDAIVKDACPDLILTSEALAAPARTMAAGACDVLPIDEVDASGGAERLESVAQPGDPALIVYTSGSTGQPKGVVWSHRGMVHRAWLSATQGAVMPADRRTLLRHFAFGAAQTDVIETLLHGATLCVFDVVAEGLTAFAAWLGQEQITVIRSPTLLLRRFLTTLDSTQGFPSVRLVSIGGDTVLPTDVDLWKRQFVPPCALSVRFASTECGVLTTVRFDHETAAGPEGATAGSPMVDVELGVVDDEGQPVPAGDEGDLIVTGAYLADGYWRRAEDTARAFTADPRDPSRRSYRTGDRGRLLPDGRFAFTGRRDQQVKIRGYRVDIAEVETVLREVDDVSEAAVVAVKENEDQRLLGFVVLRAGVPFDSAALRTRLLARLPEWKVPSRFFAVNALPATLSGKVDRQRLKEDALRQEAEQMSAAAANGELLDALETRIADVWRQVLHCDRPGPNDDFFLAGGDSLQATVLHSNMERLAGTLIPVEALFEQPTVRGMASVIRRIRRSDSRTILPVLVPFRTTGTRSPFFLVHGGRGWSFIRPGLLEALGAEQPVYGFQAAGLDWTRMRRNTIEEMAREYVRAMKQVQPQGPYLVGSACIGFLVAIEMANQLRAAGEAVGPLLLFDPPLQGRHYSHLRSRRYRYREIMRLQIAKLLGRTAWHQRVRRVLETRWGHEILQDPLDYEVGVGVRVRANLNFSIARLKYTKWRYDGPALILSSHQRLNRHRGRNKRGAFSQRLTGELQWFEAGATHDQVVRATSEVAARQIRHCIDIAQEEMARLRSLDRTCTPPGGPIRHGASPAT
jgi:amino acid adenylation domain-containing protein